MVEAQIKKYFLSAKRKLIRQAKKMNGRALLHYFSRIARREGKRFIFSIIIPVYNCEKYVGKTIDSVLKQKYVGNKHTQIILVNDGSTDGSEEICLDYQRRYPHTIQYISQPNGGVSAARNRGMDEIDGLYVNFLDSDDKWARYSFYRTLIFLKEHNCPGIVAAKEKFFDRKKGPVNRNFIFEQERIIDVEKDWWGTPLSVRNTFFKQSVIQGTRFQKGLNHSEDARFCFDILLKTGCYGAMSKPTYLYRKREASSSITDLISYDAHYYNEGITLYHDYLIAKAEEQFGCIPRFVQNELAYNIGWRIRERVTEKIENAELLLSYRQRIVGLLQRIDDDILVSQRHLNLEERLYIISLKHSCSLSDLVKSLNCDKNGNIYCSLNGSRLNVSKLANVNQLKITFYHYDENNNRMILEGVLPFLWIFPESVHLDLFVNGEKAEPEIYYRKHGKKRLAFEDGDYELFQLNFRAGFPLSDEMEISARFSLGSEKDALKLPMDMKFGRFALLATRFKENYAICDGRLYYYRDQVLHIKTATEADRADWEAKLRNEMSRKKTGREMIKFRQYAIDHLHDQRELWLFTDRATSAEDSGEELFQYFLSHPVPNVEGAFAIRDDVPDYKRISRIGNVIPICSDEYLYAMMRTTKLISSSADESVIYPFRKKFVYIKDLLRYDFVFLQHGVIKDDISGWLNRGNKNIKLFVTSAQRERQSILDGPYGYTEKEVILTGLPRFDKIKRKDLTATERSIYIMPTWRQWLAPKRNDFAESADKIETKRGGFQSSAYFLFYNGLLNNERLHKLLEENNLHLYFALHPRMGAEMDSFYSDSRVHLLKPESFNYGEVFKKMRMLITDYSSIAFNIALLRKPIVYAQFDFDEFYNSDKHTASAGYFNFVNDGFGPVVSTIDQTVDEIEKEIKMDFAVDEMYQKRAEEFFYWPEDGVTHCELVMRQILSLSNKSRN